MTLLDPFNNHVRYCALSKEKRREIVLQLSIDISNLVYTEFPNRLPMIIGLNSNWESMILAFESPQERDKIYTMILDAGVSFSDGTDGVWWGTCNGLRYHGKPVSEISQERQLSGYHKKKIQEFKEEISTAPEHLKRKLNNQLSHQLARINNRVKSQTIRPRSHKRKLRQR